jgi:SAM-dependent MidA family methyltransferase
MSSPLLALIVRRIRTDGPLSVAAFVDLALYHPVYGYYARTSQRSGRSGDFFTSVDLGPVLGTLLGLQFAEMWRLLGSPSAVDLVEAGAGNGRLSRDLLAWASAADAAFYAAIRLHLVERSAGARSQQAATLGGHIERLAAASADLPAHVRGIVFANELLDALAPHVVVMRADGLREVFVDVSAGRLCTREETPGSPRLAQYLEGVGAHLEEGWFAEINLAAVDWVRAAADSLARGFLVLLDYGHEARVLFSPTHAAGTLTAYHRHASEARDAGPAWLADPGSRDITAHVDLTAVQRAAQAGGLDSIGCLDQGYFLAGLGQAEHWFEADVRPPLTMRERLALKTLLLPGGLGSTHKVLVFGRGVGAPALKGLAFARRLT